ncbi:MAG: hypothetical protein KAV82_05740 [Phycisphaerae bacterium]|nr:hypothetical protein [Phycisphaerae bacterium]
MRRKLKYMLLCASIAAIALVEATAYAQPDRGPYTLMASEVNGGAVKATVGPYTLLGSVSPPPIGAGTLVNGPYEIDAGTAVTIVSEDCNTNGIPDDDDVAAGTSEDCNDDGIPDECEPDEDCNSNGVKDICDIGAGTSEDCNRNLVPDECEVPPIGPPENDCNTNGIPDDCDIAPSDPDGNGEVSQDCQANGVPDECDIDPTDPDGNGEVSQDCQPNGIPDECDIAQDTSQDCQMNGIPDECEIDCQPNGVPDDCDIAAGTSEDCQTNGIPDECDIADCPPGDPDCDDCNSNSVPDWCDIAQGTSVDCQTNGIPDECETDCNANGVADECDLAAGTSRDCDNNGVPDECEIDGSAWRTQDCNGNYIPDLCDIAHGTSQDVDTNGIPDECPIVTCQLVGDVAPSGASIPMHLFVENVTDLRVYLITIGIQKTFGVGTVDVECPAGVAINTNGVTLNGTHFDFVFSGLLSSPATGGCPHLRLGSTLDAGGVSVGATPAYLGTYVLDISSNAEIGSTFRMSVLDGGDSYLWDSSIQTMGFAVGPACDLTVEAYSLHATEAIGSRYLQIAPDPSPAAMALRVTSPDEACVDQYVDFDPDPILADMGVGRLVESPVVLTPADWGTVYLSDEEIIPDTTYEVRAEWPQGGLTDAASARTWLWADVNNSGGPVDEDDIECLLEGFAGDFNTCGLFADDLVGDVNDDLMGAITNAAVDLDDLMAGLDAFDGAGYPYPGPCGARHGQLAAGPTAFVQDLEPAEAAVYSDIPADGQTKRDGGMNVVIIVVPGSAVIQPGDLLKADVYISGVVDLRGYQLALDASGGTQGELTLESTSIDTERMDYVFAGLQDVHATYLARHRMASALMQGGIDSPSPEYLGTYSFRAAPDAEGAFLLQVRDDADTFLRDSARQAITIEQMSPATIHVGFLTLADYALFAECLDSSGVPYAAGCARADLDADGDVDLADFVAFQVAFTVSPP